MVRGVLAVLMLNSNQFVSLDRIVTHLWDVPPQSTKANVRKYVTLLRRILSRVSTGFEERLESRRSTGYRLVAFNDINPQAPMHFLVVPREHIATLNDLSPANDALAGALVRRGAALAAERGYAASGYRAVLNCNAAAGQTVFHLHLHVLGGRSLSWPPG